MEIGTYFEEIAAGAELQLLPSSPQEMHLEAVPHLSEPCLKSAEVSRDSVCYTYLSLQQYLPLLNLSLQDI